MFRAISGHLKLFISLVVCSLLIAGGAATVVYFHNAQKQRIVPKSISDKAGFPIYIPVKQGFNVNTRSFALSDGVLTFLVSTPGGSNVTLTEQSRPSSFSLKNFKSNPFLTSASSITTGLGSAVIGSLSKRNVAILDTNQTLVAVSANDTNDHFDDMSQLVHALQDYR